MSAPIMRVTPQKASERMRALSNTPIYIKALIYGDAGAGKTFAACTAPNPLLILSEWAVARPTLERLRKDKGIDPDTIFVNSWQDFEEAYKYAAGNVHKYDTVVLDGLTDLNDRAMEEILIAAVTRPRPGAAHDPDQLEIGDWGKVGNRTLGAVRKFRDLPCHVIITALAQENKNDLFTVPMVAPKGTQKKIAAQFNLVGYLVAEQKPGKPSVRKLHVDMSHSFQAKNPGGALPAVIENPDFSVIFPEVMEFLKGESESKELVS